MYSGILLGTWPIGGPADETREAVDRRARYEARLAADFHGQTATQKVGPLARVRGSLLGRPTTVEPCACPA